VVLINGFNSWWTGFGSGGTTLITAGMIINGAFFLIFANYITEITKRFLQNRHMNLDGRGSFFQVFSVSDFFFFQPLTGFLDAVGVGRETMGLLF